MNSSPSIILILLILSAILSASTIIGLEFYLLSSSQKGNSFWLFVSIVSALLIVLVYYQLLQNDHVTSYYSISKILSIIIVLFISMYYIGEKITIKKWIGLGLSIPTIILLAP